MESEKLEAASKKETNINSMMKHYMEMVQQQKQEEEEEEEGRRLKTMIIEGLYHRIFFSRISASEVLILTRKHLNVV